MKNYIYEKIMKTSKVEEVVKTTSKYKEMEYIREKGNDYETNFNIIDEETYDQTVEIVLDKLFKTKLWKMIMKERVKEIARVMINCLKNK